MDIIISDVRLGDEEQLVFENDPSTQGAPRVCSATPSLVNSNNKLENIEDNVLGCEIVMEIEEYKDNTQDLIADSQDEQFSPLTSIDRAVNRKPGKNEESGVGIFQYSRFFFHIKIQQRKVSPTVCIFFSLSLPLLYARPPPIHHSLTHTFSLSSSSTFTSSFSLS